MRTAILTLALLAMQSLQAETFGCFIRNYQNYCSSETVVCSESSYLNSVDFGPTVGKLCDQFLTAASLAVEINRDLSSCRDAYAAISVDKDLETARANANYSAGLYQLALVNKLRRACGSKCKRIK